MPHIHSSMQRNRHRRFTWPVILAAAASVFLPGCSAPALAPPGASVDLTLKDFSITTPTTSVPAGDVALHVYNDAPATHEFVVVRSELAPGALPLASDGISVDEDRVEAVDEIGQIATRDTATLGLTLDPGRYVFLCNLEGHYLGGMWAVLEVTDDGA